METDANCSEPNAWAISNINLAIPLPKAPIAFPRKGMSTINGDRRPMQNIMGTPNSEYYNYRKWRQEKYS